MPPTEKPPPLPLAPDRAVISNRISLLLAHRSSFLKTLNPHSSTNTTAATKRSSEPRRHDDGDDTNGDLFRTVNRPNEGLGYVPDSKATNKNDANVERRLRGRLLGKRKGPGASAVVDGRAGSESDEETGRSGLGKRKRPRRAVAEEIVHETPKTKDTPVGEEDKTTEDPGVDVDEDVNMNDAKSTDGERLSETMDKLKMKKKKKKKKKQQAITS